MSIEAFAKLNLKHGQALVICGPQGSGKTTLARKIAARHGTYAQIDALQLTGHFGLGDALSGETKTLIVDGIPESRKALKEIRAALTNETITIHQRYQNPKIVKSPNFIFCSGAENPLPWDAQDRRFVVIRLQG